MASGNENKPILVVGGSGAIGGSVARILGRAGHSVGLHYCSNQEAVHATAKDLASMGAQHVVLSSPLRAEEDCQGLIDKFVSKMGSIYGLAMCAGRVPWQPWKDLDVPEWHDVFREHTIVPFFLAKAASAYMAENGRVVYLSSISAKYGGSPLTMHYAAAKSALEAAMRGLARELAPSGVRVNGVRSGYIETAQQLAGRSNMERVARVARIPLGRAGTPDEVASAVGYLFTNDAAFITGEIFTVAGGD